MGHAQRVRLSRPPMYEESVARLVREARVVQYKREGAERRPEFFRVHVTLRLNAATVDLFHNAPSGYRAQYYSNRGLGDRANAFVLSASPRRSRKTSSVVRWMLQRSGRSDPSAGGGSLPGVVVGFRALSFMPGLFGCRHRSPDGVQ